jgi:hypothetical protein
MGHSRFLGGIAAGLVSCVCAGGCSPGDRPPQSLSRDAAIAQLSASGNAMYSFRLTGPYPGGAYGHFVIVTSAPAVACGRYAGPDVTDDYWFVDIELGDVVKGVYVAATNSVTGTKSMAANVSILHRTSGTYAANFPATSGRAGRARPTSTSTSVFQPRLYSSSAARGGQRRTARGESRRASASARLARCPRVSPTRGSMTTAVRERETTRFRS